MAQPKKTCSVLNCDNEDTSEVCLFNFPTDFNLCMLWVQNTGKPEHFEDFAFGGALPFLTRYVCSEHFSSVDFVDIKEKRKGLLPGAVPLLNYVELNDVKIKEEVVDVEYGDTAESISKLNVDIKEEPFEDDGNPPNICDFTDPLADSFTAESSKEEQQLSDEFFCNYRVARKRTSLKARRAWAKKLKRNEETEEQKKERNMKNALRAAIRRQNETPEQRERRRINDLLRARRRRSAETEQETRIRRYNDAVRAALRRQNETEEQRAERRMYDSKRAAFRRSQESPEQRALRLKKDRERASRNRLLKKIFQQVHMLENMHEFMPLSETIPVPDPVPSAMDTSDNFEAETQASELPNAPPDIPLNIATIGSAVKGCNENTNINRLQEVLQFLKQNSKTQGEIPPAQLRDAIVNFDNSLQKDSFSSYSAYLANAAIESGMSKKPETPILGTGSQEHSGAASGIANSDDGSHQEQIGNIPAASSIENQKMDMELDNPPVTAESQEDTYSAAKRGAAVRNSTENLEVVNMVKGAGYRINLADIPKELRDRLGSSERDANWESSAAEGNLEYFDKSVSHAEEDNSGDDYVEMPPVAVELHEDADDAADRGTRENAEYCVVNLANIPKEIGDNEQSANWENGLVEQETG